MVATLETRLIMRDQLTPGLRNAAQEGSRFERTMGGLGKTVLGTAGGFIAAQLSVSGVQMALSKTVGAAAAFDGQMAQIRALTNATADDTDFLSGRIKELTKTLPKSPEELGAGAYFILSSGIDDAATAMEVLELSAKASTIGLGDTQTIASTLTSVMNAYQLGAEDAAKATDTLVNIVKLGKGEPAELAQSLGFVIPVAAQMGVEFEQVGAVLATLTNTGLNAAEAVTALRGIFTQILSPTDEARKTFAALGIDVDAFRQKVDEDFIGAMTELAGAVGDNEQAWAQLFPEVRGMVGVMAAFGNQLPATQANLQGITDGTGALNSAFEQTSQTAEFKLNKALNDLNVELAELGIVALPLVASGAGAASEAIGGTADAVRELDDALGFLGTGFEQVILAMPGFSQARAALDLKDVLEGDRSKLDDVAIGLFNIRPAADIARHAIGGIFGDSGGADELSVSVMGLADSEKQAEVNAAAFNEAVAAMNSEADAAAGSTAGLGTAVDGLGTSLDKVFGARTQEQAALDLQINALEQEKNAAMQAEMGQGALSGAVISTTDALQEQIDALGRSIASNEAFAASFVPDSLYAEIIALERELQILELGKVAIEGQIAARQALASLQLELARIQSLPEATAQKRLELEKARILERGGGDVENLKGRDRKRIEAIDEEIKKLQGRIDVRRLEAELLNLQAEARNKNLERETRQLFQIEQEIRATGSLKRERELLIETLVPVELLQEIEVLQRQQTELGLTKDATGEFTAAIGLQSDAIQTKVDKLHLEREALDLVTEGWKLQGEAMLGLPSVDKMAGYIGLIAKFGPNAPIVKSFGEMIFGGAPGFQHGGFIPPGVVTPAILHGGRHGEDVIPRGGGGRALPAAGNMTFVVNSRYPPNRGQLRAEAEAVMAEWRRKLAWEGG